MLCNCIPSMYATESFPVVTYKPFWQISNQPIKKVYFHPQFYLTCFHTTIPLSKDSSYHRSVHANIWNKLHLKGNINPTSDSYLWLVASAVPWKICLIHKYKIFSNNNNILNYFYILLELLQRFQYLFLSYTSAKD